MGDVIAMVVADNEAQAKTRSTPQVDWNALPAVVDMEEGD